MSGRRTVGFVLTGLFLIWCGGPGWAKDTPPLRVLKQAVQEQPTDPQAFFNLGLKYESLGKSKEAMGAYRQAIRLKSDYVEAYHHLARTLGDSGEYDEAIKTLQKALKIKPDYAEARILLGKVYTGQGLALGQEGRWSSAIDAFQAAIRTDPEAEAPRNNLGVAYFNEKRLSDAVEAFQQALGKNPDNPQAHYNLALLYFVTGNHEAAYVEFFNLKALDPAMAGELNQIRFGVKKTTEYTGPPMKTIPGPFFTRGVVVK